MWRLWIFGGFRGIAYIWVLAEIITRQYLEKKLETTEIKYSLKYSFLNSAFDYIIFIFGFYLLSLININELKVFSFNNYFLPALSLIFIFFYGKRIILELLNLKNKIIFTKDHLQINNKVYKWADISKQQIISKKEYTPKYNLEYKEFYLSFIHKKEKIELKIDNYVLSTNEFKNLLTKYSTTKDKTNSTDKTFKNIFTYDEYFELNESESEKEISKTLALCEKNINGLTKFCIENTFNETDKVNFIYYCLSEEPKKWDNFLTNEFLRVYKLSLIDNSFNILFPLLENIMVEDIDTKDAELVRTELFNQINSTNLLIRLKSIQLINCWVDKEILEKNQILTSKLKSKLNDENWKVRWNAHNVLKDNEIEVENLGIMDKLKAKYQNQYEI